MEKKGHREKLRERFMADDEVGKTEESILETLLTYSIPRKDVRPVAKNLLKGFGNLSGVLEADHDQLCKKIALTPVERIEEVLQRALIPQ